MELIYLNEIEKRKLNDGAGTDENIIILNKNERDALCEVVRSARAMFDRNMVISVDQSMGAGMTNHKRLKNALFKFCISEL